MSNVMLTIKPIPTDTHGFNLRTLVPDLWRDISSIVRQVERCDCCGTETLLLDAHEEWQLEEYSHLSKQRLVDIMALCKPCHAVKHLIRTRITSSPEKYMRVIRHMMRVNGWTLAQVEEHIQHTMSYMRDMRNMKWILNLQYAYDSYLVPPINHPRVDPPQ